MDSSQQQITESKKRTMGCMRAQELAWMLKSKQDFIVYLDQHCKCLPFPSSHPPFLTVQYYLPDEAVVNKDFLKDVLAGKKMLLKKAEVEQIKVPCYDELSVKALWP